MAGQSRRIHTLDPDRIETHSNASRVETDLAYQPCLCDHLDRRLLRLLDGQDDEVLLLRFHPVPVLGEKARIARSPRESRAAIAEHAEGNLGADVAGYDVGEVDLCAVGDA